MSAKPLDTVVSILKEFAEDWGLDELQIGPDTMLKADIGFESSDTMQLFSAIQEEYPQVKLTFQDLVIVDGKFLDDIAVSQVAAFITQSLKSAGTAA
jgi:acyl carrier protein